MVKLLLLSAILTLSACAPTATRYFAATEHEIKAETQLQKKLISEIKVKDRIKYQERLQKVSNRVLQAGAGLCGVLKDTDNICDFKVELSSDNQVNAYADGEKIVVDQGMMDFIKSEDELAIVLSHEFAHNLMGHPQSKKTNAIIGALLGAVLDGLAGANEGTASNLGARLGATAYSHSSEFEADYVGLYVAARAGFNIQACANFWRRMSVISPNSIYFSSATHPTNPERYIAMDKATKEIEAKRRTGQELVPTVEVQ